MTEHEDREKLDRDKPEARVRTEDEARETPGQSPSSHETASLSRDHDDVTERDDHERIDRDKPDVRMEHDARKDPAASGLIARYGRLLLVAIIVVYAALYVRAIGFEYVWDDVATIRDSPQFERPLRESVLVTQHGHISSDITRQRLRGVAPSHESYRPFLFLTFALDYALFGKSTAAMHAHNILEGVIAILLAWALARRLASRAAALFVAAVFALHPLHVEPFAYVSARADLLSGLLALAVALCVVETTDESGAPRPMRQRVGLGALACFLFLLSLFTKEATIGLPLALAAIGLALGRLRSWRWPLVVMLATAGVHFFLRRMAAPGGVPVAPRDAMMTALINLPGVALDYAAHFVAPISLSIARPLLKPWIIAGWIVLAGAMIAIALFRRRALATRERRLIAAGLAWTIIMVGPAAIGIVILKAVADRYAFLPLFGLALSAGLFIEATRRRYVLFGAMAWGAVMIVITAINIGFWHDERELYGRAVAMEPGSATAHFSLGTYFAQKNLWPAAITELEAATRFDDSNVLAFNNLGVAYLNMERYDDAEKAFLRAIELMSGFNFRAWYNLASIYRTRGDLPRACDALASSLAINPGYAKALDDAHRYCPKLKSKSSP